MKYSTINYFILLTLLTIPNISLAHTEVKLLTISWGLPFVGLLLSIALCPLLLAKFWHRYFGRITLGWVLVLLIPLSYHYGLHHVFQIIKHILITEYLPFIIILLTLFTLAGGVFVESHWQANAKLNTTLLAIGTLLSSFMGTTGATMLLIRPLLQINQHRQHQLHLILFFIFLVGNIGGGLTPLGDPPLFIGFLHGVDFLWVIRNMAAPLFLSALFLLTLFYFFDRYYLKQEKNIPTQKPHLASITIYGKVNLLLLCLVIAIILLSAIYQSEKSWYGMNLTSLIRDMSLLIITGLSLILTPKMARQRNQFSWQPIIEIAKLFAGIFITIMPVIALLHNGSEGALGIIINSVHDLQGNASPMRYFWLTGLLSSLLDNAPTYLVFFNLASGDPHYLMQQGSSILLAISMGSVFMGALTYIGNAPNFMVKSIAEQQGIKMPSFFGYLKWSISLLIPLFIGLSLIFF